MECKQKTPGPKAWQRSADEGRGTTIVIAEFLLDERNDLVAVATDHVAEYNTCQKTKHQTTSLRLSNQADPVEVIHFVLNAHCQ